MKRRMLFVVIAVLIIGYISLFVSKYHQEQKRKAAIIAVIELKDCQAQQFVVKNLADFYHETYGKYPQSLKVLEQFTGLPQGKHFQCPSGGKYSYSPETGKLTCSIHPPRPNPAGASAK